MGDNVKVLKGPAVGPDGDRFKAGQQVPAHWPAWFVTDLERGGHLTEPRQRTPRRKATP